MQSLAEGHTASVFEGQALHLALSLGQGLDPLPHCSQQRGLFTNAPAQQSGSLCLPPEHSGALAS